MHSPFQGQWAQGGRETGIFTPNSASEKAAACSRAMRLVRLQHRGPPMAVMASRQAAVSLWGTAQASGVNGVAPETMEAKIPAPAAAPQTPRKPQDPPVSFCPRFQASRRFFSKSSSPPQFR